MKFARRPFLVVIPGNDERSSESGFTLLELLVTLTILALLAAIVTPQVVKYLDSSRVKTAKVQVAAIETALDLFRADVGRYPTAQEGLQVLVVQPDNVANWAGPYLKKAKGLVDPWGVPYHYRVPGQHGEVDLYSFGEGKTDGDANGDPEIANW